MMTDAWLAEQDEVRRAREEHKEWLCSQWRSPPADDIDPDEADPAEPPTTDSHEAAARMAEAHAAYDADIREAWRRR